MSCSYDALDRLTEVKIGAHRYRYTYDPFHRRLSRVILENDEEVRRQEYLYCYESEIGLIENGEMRLLRVQGDRFDGIGKGDGYYNKISKEYIKEPHVHDPLSPGSIRKPFIWEMPR